MSSSNGNPSQSPPQSRSDYSLLHQVLNEEPAAGRETLYTSVRSALDEVYTLRELLESATQQTGQLQANLDSVSQERDLLLVRQDELEDSLRDSRTTAANATAAPHPITDYRRSPEHPDPTPWDATNLVAYPLTHFITLIQLKLNANSDWFPTPLSRVAYFIGRLAGPALDQVTFGIDNTTGHISFLDMNEVVSVLETAYGDNSPEITASAKIIGLIQDKRSIQVFLPEWQRVAHETGWDDLALIGLLRHALHPAILDRLSFDTSSNTVHDLPTFLRMVRATDATLRRLRPNYYTQSTTASAAADPTLAPRPFYTAPPPSTPLTTANGGDAMDMSAVWTGNQGGTKRPRTEAERIARREYCWKHQLCLFCESPEHKIASCPLKPKQRPAPKQVSIEDSGKA